MSLPNASEKPPESRAIETDQDSPTYETMTELLDYYIYDVVQKSPYRTNELANSLSYVYESPGNPPLNPAAPLAWGLFTRELTDRHRFGFQLNKDGTETLAPPTDTQSPPCYLAYHSSTRLTECSDQYGHIVKMVLTSLTI